MSVIDLVASNDNMAVSVVVPEERGGDVLRVQPTDASQSQAPMVLRDLRCVRGDSDEPFVEYPPCHNDSRFFRMINGFMLRRFFTSTNAEKADKNKALHELLMHAFPTYFDNFNCTEFADRFEFKINREGVLSLPSDAGLYTRVYALFKPGIQRAAGLFLASCFNSHTPGISEYIVIDSNGIAQVKRVTISQIEDSITEEIVYLIDTVRDLQQRS